jgi:RNA polymerase primary sigma factor
MKIRKIENNLEIQLRRKPTLKEIADIAGVEQERVAATLNAFLLPVSIESAVPNSDDKVIGDSIGSISEDYEKVDTDNDFNRLTDMLNFLSERELQIIKLRNGLGTGDPMTLQQVGNLLGITRERVRQIEDRAVAKLRHPSLKKYLDGYV